MMLPNKLGESRLLSFLAIYCRCLLPGAEGSMGYALCLSIWRRSIAKGSSCPAALWRAAVVCAPVVTTLTSAFEQLRRNVELTGLQKSGVLPVACGETWDTCQITPGPGWPARRLRRCTCVTRSWLRHIVRKRCGSARAIAAPFEVGQARG